MSRRVSIRWVFLLFALILAAVASIGYLIFYPAAINSYEITAYVGFLSVALIVLYGLFCYINLDGKKFSESLEKAKSTGISDEQRVLLAAENFYQSELCFIRAKFNIVIIVAILICGGAFFVFVGHIMNNETTAFTQASRIKSQIGNREDELREKYTSQMQKMQTRIAKLLNEFNQTSLANLDLTMRRQASSEKEYINNKVSRIAHIYDVNKKWTKDYSEIDIIEMERKIFKEDRVLSALYDNYDRALSKEAVPPETRYTEKTLIWVSLLLRAMVALIGIYLIIHLIEWYKYNMKLANLYHARACAFVLPDLKAKPFLQQVAAMTAEHIDVGRPSINPLDYVATLFGRAAGDRETREEYKGLTTLPRGANTKSIEG